jgi:hypothetical protein
LLSAECRDAAVVVDFVPPALLAVFALPAQAQVDFVPPALLAVFALLVQVQVDFVLPVLVDFAPLVLADLDQAVQASAHLRGPGRPMALCDLARLDARLSGGHLCRAVTASTTDLTTSIITGCFSTIVLAFHADRLSSSAAASGSVSAVGFLDGPTLDRPSMDLPIIRITLATTGMGATDTEARLRRNQWS